MWRIWSLLNNVPLTYLTAAIRRRCLSGGLVCLRQVVLQPEGSDKSSVQDAEVRTLYCFECGQMVVDFTFGGLSYFCLQFNCKFGYFEKIQSTQSGCKGYLFNDTQFIESW